MCVQSLRALNAVATAVVVALAAGATGLPAADLVVTTFSDELNSDGDCSLREAVQAANWNTPVDACGAGEPGVADLIKLPAGTYRLSIRGYPEDANLAGDLDVVEQLVIDGDDAGAVIDGGAATEGDHVLDVLGGRLELRDLTLTGAQPTFGAQGAIEVDPDAELVLRRCAVTGNSGGSGSFGILVHGTLEAHETVISGNRASMGAGVFCLAEATVELTRVEISDNHADYGGAGIDCSGGSSLTLRNCQVVRNSTGLGGSGSGAGIVTASNTVIEDSTISDNVTGFGGAAPAGGLWIKDDWVSVSGSTISGNWADPGAAILVGSPAFGGFGRSIVLLDNVTITDNRAMSAASSAVAVLEDEALVWFTACTIADNGGAVELIGGSEGLFGATVVAGYETAACAIDPRARVTSLGDNLEDGDTCGFTHPSDLVDTDPMLGVLAGSAGLPQTMVPLVGSPLVDTASWAPVPGVDQRQLPRPQDGDSDGIAIADRGAVEYLGDVLFTDGFDRGGSWRWSTEIPSAE